MRVEKIDLRFVNRHRVDIEPFKNIGFKTIEKHPTHLRMSEIDDMRRLMFEGDGYTICVNELKMALEEMGYTTSSDTQIGKRCIGYFEYVFREYKVYIWK